MAASAKNMMDLVRAKRAAMRASSGRRETTHKPQPGKNRYRILPSWRGAEEVQFFHEFGQHFIKGSDGTLKAVYVCTEKTYGKPCEICEALAAATVRTDSSDETMKTLLKESSGKTRYLMNALHLDGEDPSSPVILDLTPTTFDKVLVLAEEYGDITALDSGVDIIITRTGKGLNTEYSVLTAAKSAPVAKTVLKSLHNLDEYVQQEYEEGRMKALAAVSAVTGVLPARAARPALVAPAAAPSPEADTWAAPTAATAIAGTFVEEDDDIPFEAATPAVAATEEMSDDDLDALLDGMRD